MFMLDKGPIRNHTILWYFALFLWFFLNKSVFILFKNWLWVCWNFQERCINLTVLQTTWKCICLFCHCSSCSCVGGSLQCVYALLRPIVHGKDNSGSPKVKGNALFCRCHSFRFCSLLPFSPLPVTHTTCAHTHTYCLTQSYTYTQSLKHTHVHIDTHTCTHSYSS